jgi:hypothetical protein
MLLMPRSVQTSPGIIRVMNDLIVSSGGLTKDGGHDQAMSIDTRLVLVEELAGSGRATFELTRKGESSLKRALRNCLFAKVP